MARAVGMKFCMSTLVSGIQKNPVFLGDAIHADFVQSGEYFIDATFFFRLLLHFPSHSSLTSMFKPMDDSALLLTRFVIVGYRPLKACIALGKVVAKWQVFASRGLATTLWKLLLGRKQQEDSQKNKSEPNRHNAHTIPITDKPGRNKKCDRGKLRHCYDNDGCLMSTDS